METTSAVQRKGPLKRCADLDMSVVVSRQKSLDPNEPLLEEAQQDEEEEEEGWDDKPHRITMDGLYLGSMEAANNLVALQEKGITHILMVGERLKPMHEEHFKYCHIKVDDIPEEDLVAHFPKAFEFIGEVCKGDNSTCLKGGGILVHCAAGVSRSATVCLGWLMCKHNHTLDEAWTIVHNARPWICPNLGFRLQLEELERLGIHKSGDLSKWRAWRHVYYNLQRSNSFQEGKLSDSKKNKR
mmetsp:Transcript_26577/g.57826  ORF Transcript_26577/g.57826 Transcript_26577/m.57826 type:complete len:242 (-) Transcript_26577:133-858(-)|eukprot:CAMPEP_0118945716 /NCGR_PEP_ID=MMETSP1169-20130426/42805_1 /TAXON_ID=36882 /ORGANISM="Pyramimonas obovata, Strain CCMP722" /LENGTH=241 /DNA_ID=CAMNT_0006891495 /DNA_START=223 /DNA_END=948 /DNA_ORIENTATION=-